MRLRFGIRALLALIAVVCVALACVPQLYSTWELQSRRRHTLDRLCWSGGTDADRAIRDRLIAAVDSSTHDSLRKPHLVVATAGEHRDLGYCVTADWISRTPIADGMQITFHDGSTSKVKFIDAFIAWNDSNSREMVLFQGSVYRNEFPVPSNRSNVGDVAWIALLSGDEVCSNRVAVEHSPKLSTKPTDECEPE